MLMCTSVAGLVSVLWIAIGYSLAFGSGFSVADATGAEVANPILGGLDKLFVGGIGIDALHGDIPELAFVLFQGMFALITVAIISGGVRGTPAVQPLSGLCRRVGRPGVRATRSHGVGRRMGRHHPRRL